jgi:hypothetical protein
MPLKFPYQFGYHRHPRGPNDAMDIVIGRNKGSSVVP